MVFELQLCVTTSPRPPDIQNIYMHSNQVDMDGQMHTIVPIFEFMVSTGVAERERWPFVSTLTSSQAWWITTPVSNSWRCKQRQGQYPADLPLFLASDTALMHCPSFEMPLTTLKNGYMLFFTMCPIFCIASIEDWEEVKNKTLLLQSHLITCFIKWWS